MQEKGPYAICGHCRPRSACTFMHADLALHWPLTESTDTVVYVDKHRMSRPDHGCAGQSGSTNGIGPLSCDAHHINSCMLHMLLFEYLLIIAPDNMGYPNIFLISPWNRMLWVLLEMPQRDAYYEYPPYKDMFSCKIRKYSYFMAENRALSEADSFFNLICCICSW